MTSAKPTEDTESASPTVSRKAQIGCGVSISLFTVVLILGIIEWVAFRWEQQLAQDELGWTLVASRRMPVERYGDAERPYYLFEKNQDYNWEGIDVHINENGLRGDDIVVPKPESTFRILNIGDSVAFGWEVAEADTYGKQLERMLNGRNDGINYEVINAGVPGWNLKMERDFLLQEGIQYEPDLIILDLTLVNDIYGQGPAVSEDPGLFDWLRDNTYTWPFITTQARFAAAQSQGPEAIPVLNPPTEAKAYYPIDEDAPRWDELWEYIKDIDEYAQSENIPFGLLAFPTALQLNSAEHPLTPQLVFGSRAEASGIGWMDLTPIYQNVCEESGEDACEGFVNVLFSDVWMHPNVVGHQLAADLVFEFVESSQDPTEKSGVK